MPHLCVIASGAAQRRQLADTAGAFEKRGFALTSKLEGKGGDVSWSALFAAGRSAGLFAAKQLFVIESAEGLGEFPQELEQFLEPASAECVIICVFGAEFKKVFSTDAVKKIGFLAKEETVAPWKRKEWITRLAKERGVQISADAASLLAETVEEQEELRGEIAKLSEFCKPGQITLEAVQAISFDEGAGALLRFLDGFSKRKTADVFSALVYLKRDPSPLPVLTALVNRLRPAVYISVFRDESKALAAAGARDYAARMAKSALEIYGNGEIQRFILQMIRLSFLEKTNSAEGWYGFESAVLLMMKHGQ